MLWYGCAAWTHSPASRNPTPMALATGGYRSQRGSQRSRIRRLETASTAPAASHMPLVPHRSSIRCFPSSALGGDPRVSRRKRDGAWLTFSKSPGLPLELPVTSRSKCRRSTGLWRFRLGNDSGRDRRTGCSSAAAPERSTSRCTPRTGANHSSAPRQGADLKSGPTRCHLGWQMLQ